jgi:acetolactate synthase-1/2/3 large subunit
MGNNGIWALEKHPMEFLYGYSVAAELRPGDALRPGRRGARRPRRARARAPDELRPALERAFAAASRRS